MSNQDFHRGSTESTRAGGSASERMSRAAKDATSTASAFAEETTGKVKQAASDTAESLTGEVKELLNRQVGGGADMLGHLARSARSAADDLEHDSPQIAGLARSLASQVDRYAGGLRDQSIDEIWRTAADFTRRQPALVFGLAALAGFFALRTVKSSPSISAPPIQPSHQYDPGRGRAAHGL
jgi:ABC-type transporter Mla subunit MlaD